MNHFLNKHRKAIAAIVLLGAAIGSYIYGANLRAALQHNYAQTSTEAGHTPLELITAYQPSPGVSDIAEQRGDIDLQPMETFYRVLRAVRENYVERIEPPQEKEMAYGALRSMLGALNDPNSRFLEPEKYDTLKDQLKGKFHGMGAILAIRKSVENNRETTKLVVISALPDTPAEKNGLKPGDVISYLDSQWIVSYDPYIEVNKLAKLVQARRAEKSALTRAFEAAEAKLRKATTAQKAYDTLTSSVKKEYNITVVRSGEKLPIEMKVPSAHLQIEPVSSKILSDGIGYLAIRFITVDTPSAVSAALNEMRKNGVNKLVVDLRGCAGGADTALPSVLSDICPGKVLAILRKSRNKEQILRAEKSEHTQQWQKIAVIVDRGTAHLGEVAAACLRDSANAVIVGEQTYGHAKQQTIVPQRDGSAIIFTTGEYLTPKRQSFDKKGITPTVKASSTGAATDEALDKAIEAIAGVKTAREAAGA